MMMIINLVKNVCNVVGIYRCFYLRLFVFLFVCNITQNIIDRFVLNVHEMFIMAPKIGE